MFSLLLFKALIFYIAAQNDKSPTGRSSWAGRTYSPAVRKKKSMVRLNLSIINSNLGHDNRLLLLKGFTFALSLVAHIINTTQQLTVIS